MKKNLLLLMVLTIVFAFVAVSCDSDGGASSFTVTFDFDNGSPNSKVEVENGGTLAGKLPKNPTKEGTIIFIEWRKADGTAVDDRTPITENLVLKAAYWKDFMTASDEEKIAVQMEFTRMALIASYLGAFKEGVDVQSGKATDRYELETLVSLLCVTNGELFNPDDIEEGFAITIEGEKKKASDLTSTAVIVNGGVLEGFEYEMKTLKIKNLTFRVNVSDLGYESDEVVISDIKAMFANDEKTNATFVSLMLGNKTHTVSLENGSLRVGDYRNIPLS